jgi:hypothetical protein
MFCTHCLPVGNVRTAAALSAQHLQVPHWGWQPFTANAVHSLINGPDYRLAGPWQRVGRAQFGAARRFLPCPDGNPVVIA